MACYSLLQLMEISFASKKSLMLERKHTTFLCFFKIFLILGLLGREVRVDAQPTLRSKSKKAIAYYQQADNHRVRKQYQQAIALLENAIKKDGQFTEAYLRLADIYHDIEELVLARQNYQRAIDLAQHDVKYASAYLSITEVLISLEEYHQANAYIEKFLSYRPKDQRKNNRALLLREQIIYAIDHIDPQFSFNPRPLSSKVNKFAMQYFPVITATENKLFYTKRDGNTPYDDEDIVVSTKDENGNWGIPESISSNINSELNEGTCAISADGRTLVFTSCQARQGYGSCDLYISRKNGESWSVPENMGAIINSSTWDSQPSLSADGRTLYFASNRKGGFGGRDIWVTRQSQRRWMVPTNLGEKINTSNEEVSPFIHPNGRVLYFASDGLPGFGGFDIYYNELDSVKKWGSPRNIGYPINRGTDQMSLIITADGSKGFYSDSGGSNQRLSSIKQFDVPKQIRIRHKSYCVTGRITDQKTHAPLGTQIELYDLSNDELIGEVSSDSITGQYLIVLTEGGRYGLYVEREGYVFQSVNFDFKNSIAQQPLVVDLELDPIEKGAITVLNNVFFKHDSYELSKASLIELGKVARFIESNEVKLEIGGYTDALGTPAYNLSLSQKRAKAVYDYLVEEKNISPNELTFHGYGEDNTSQSGESQWSRRIEFKLL